MSRYFCGAVLVGPDVAHRVAGEDALEDGGVDDGGGHGGSFGEGVGSGAGALQGALRLQHDRAVDHSAVELGGAGRCGLGGEHAARPVESASRSGAGRRGWARPGAGGCTAWRRSRGARDQARSASRRCSSSSCGVTPATGAGRPATREAMAMHAGGVREAVGAVGDVAGRGRARSRACRRPGARRRRRRPPHAPSRRRARFRSARARAASGTAARTACTCAADSALGSITPRDARLAQQAQVVGERSSTRRR